MRPLRLRYDAVAHHLQRHQALPLLRLLLGAEAGLGHLPVEVDPCPTRSKLIVTSPLKKQSRTNTAACASTSLFSRGRRIGTRLGIRIVAAKRTVEFAEVDGQNDA